MIRSRGTFVNVQRFAVCGEDVLGGICYVFPKEVHNHVAIMVFLGICILGVAATGCFLKNAWIGYGAFLLLIIAHCWRNNAMMTYVENNAYDGKGNA